MKKLFFLLTVCVISLPLKANTPPSEELCNDEVFIAFCNEGLELAQLFKMLDKVDLNPNADVKCLKESLAEKAVYLQKTYALFDESPQNKFLLGEAIHAAIESNKISQNVQEDCLVVYIGLATACSITYPYPQLEEWAACLALADIILLACLGIA